MTRTPLILALAAAAALAGCNKENHTIVAGGPQEEPENTVAEANVTLPPSIAASKVYRCADNDVVYVDWMSDGKTANVRIKKDAPPTQVVAAEAGQPMTAAGGYSVSGKPDAASVRIAVPGQKEESCKA